MADYSTEQNLRLAQKMLEQQGEINTLRAELAALKAAIGQCEIARFAADVLSLVDDYSDRERSIIARLPFLATFDQVCFEKYGINTDQIAALAAPETPDSSKDPAGSVGTGEGGSKSGCAPETPGDADV